VPWILLVDQAVFVVCDWLAGIHADRVGAAVSRLGRHIALVTGVSCAAFLALPLVASAGSALFIALAILWSASSSILRAPSLTLAGRHAARPERAWLASFYAFGLGAAGAVAPYLTGTLATTDPRIPFIATSVIVAALTVVLAAIPHDAPPAHAAPAPPAHGASAPPAHGASVPAGPAPGLRSLPGFAVAVVLLAIGFQIHSSITSPAIYLRFVARDELADVLPVFWIGFNIAALPLALIVQRTGGPLVLTAAATLGALALIPVQLAASLSTVIVAQLVAGLAWSGILVGAFAIATDSEKPGTTTGMLFSILAAATVARIAVVATGLSADIATTLPWIPPATWALATLVAAATIARRDRTA
jgi:MFS family permease